MHLLCGDTGTVENVLESVQSLLSSGPTLFILGITVLLTDSTRHGLVHGALVRGG